MGNYNSVSYMFLECIILYQNMRKHLLIRLLSFQRFSAKMHYWICRKNELREKILKFGKKFLRSAKILDSDKAKLPKYLVKLKICLSFSFVKILVYSPLSSAKKSKPAINVICFKNVKGNFPLYVGRYFFSVMLC